MKTPKCKSCNHQLEWKELYTSLWFPRKKTQCNKCKSNHNITTPLYVSILAAQTGPLSLVIINFMSFSSIFMGLVVLVAITLVLIMIISLFIPFFAKCSLVE
ncbi:TIGR04104 family putative zinc finger protein [Ornithinibacillus halophilus]|uniref:Cxxc_20_cxxc protein n=1 Tax=Ornithinibacillus halophilus TaxID=930117 RepID=A0A1M5DEZ1_9BACI|nr:cxxc_20_cxxc protein [Ornithinibacillus halophilus]